MVQFAVDGVAVEEGEVLREVAADLETEGAEEVAEEGVVMAVLAQAGEVQEEGFEDGADERVIQGVQALGNAVWRVVVLCVNVADSLCNLQVPKRFNVKLDET